jgi:hypothetical protein
MIHKENLSCPEGIKYVQTSVCTLPEIPKPNTNIQNQMKTIDRKSLGTNSLYGIDISHDHDAHRKISSFICEQSIHSSTDKESQDFLKKSAENTTVLDKNKIPSNCEGFIKKKVPVAGDIIQVLKIIIIINH